MKVNNRKHNIVCSFAYNALDGDRDAAQRDEEGVNGENSVERRGARYSYSASLLKSRGSFTFFALKYILGVSVNFWQSSAGLDHPDEFLLG